MRGLAVVFVATLLVCLAAGEYCHPSACIEAIKCDVSKRLTTMNCPANTDVCCNEIEPKDKTRCAHYGGECMNYCGEPIRIRQALDCKNQMCCVLV